MRVTQEAWDSLWENSAGTQEKMFDENGDRFPDRRIKLYIYQPVFLPALKFPILTVVCAKDAIS
jgi:hypothetical protein